MDPLQALLLDDLRPSSVPPDREEKQQLVAPSASVQAPSASSLQQAIARLHATQQQRMLNSSHESQQVLEQRSVLHEEVPAGRVLPVQRQLRMHSNVAMPRSAPGFDQTADQVELDPSHAVLASLLQQQQQIQESSRAKAADAYRNLRSQLRFASSCAVLGDLGSRGSSYTAVSNPGQDFVGAGAGWPEVSSQSASQVAQLEGLMQAFSPRASLSTTSVIGAQPPAPAQTGAGPSIWGQMAEQDLQQSSTGVLIDPLFGPGIASAGLSPRSSIASMQALLAEPGGNMGSPARNSPMSQSFSHSQGGAGKETKQLLHPHLARTKAPSKLRIGSTAEHLQQPPAVDNTLEALVASLPTTQAGIAELSSEPGVVPTSVDTATALRDVLAAVQGSSSASPSQQQQLQNMYLALSGYGVPQGYAAPAMTYTAAAPQAHQAGYSPAQVYQTQQPAQTQYYQSIEMLGVGPAQPVAEVNLRQPSHQFHPGIPGVAGIPPVSPAEYAAYYQQYMENQAALAAAMGLSQGLDPVMAVPAHDKPLMPEITHLQPNGRHRSLGGVATHVNIERARSGGYAIRNSGEWQGPGSTPLLGPGRSENGADASAMAAHLERLQLGGSGPLRRNSRRADADILPAGAAHRGSAVLEHFKVNTTKKYELCDIGGHVCEFSQDQHGSRFIQQKLETATPEELSAALAEVLPRATHLMTDVFGNYVVQKFLEHASPEQRLKIAEAMEGQVLQLSLQMYGCRVVQKALEVLPVDAQCAMLAELDGNVMRCVRDQNGNHVIQKIIECVPTVRISALLDNFLPCVVQLSSHPFGCRVMQRILEHCNDDVRRGIVMEEVLKSAHTLAQDQYGNYVVQHVLEYGTDAEKRAMVSTLAPHIVSLSVHKFASNVVEKCLTHATPTERDQLVKSILGPDALPAPNTQQGQGSGGGGSNGPLSGEVPGIDGGVEDALTMMMKDQFGNYVVQRVLEVCDDAQRDNLLQRVRAQLHHLKKFTYGKHIVARVEKLLSAGAKIQSHLRSRPLPGDSASLRASAPSAPVSGSLIDALSSRHASEAGTLEPLPPQS